MTDKERFLEFWTPTLGADAALESWTVKEAQERKILGCYIAPDIEPYQSMCTGEMITSRSHHRDHLKQHNLNEVGNEVPYLERRAKEIVVERAKANEAKLVDRIKAAVYKHLGG